MKPNVKPNMSNSGIYDDQSEYIQSGVVSPLKHTYQDFSYIVIIKGNNPKLEVAKIQMKLRQFGYTIEPYNERGIGTRRMYSTSDNLRTKKLARLLRRSNVLFLRVVAPKPPVSPPPFSDPNGKPARKRKNKKGLIK
jgi:hypothetical protein